MENIVAEFDLDVKQGEKTVEVTMPFSEVAPAADKINSLLQDTASSSSAMMQIRDADTGEYVFLNSMKISSVRLKD